MKVGLVLSGGGARGISHLGVVKALNEHQVKIDFISGTSAGAVVGGFLAHGYTPEEALDALLRTNLYKAVRPAMSWRGILKIERLESMLRPYFSDDSFEALQIPLFVAATNVRKGVLDIFSSGELIRPMLASCCLPVIFEPLKIKGQTFMDGGIINNLPVEPLIGKATFIIGSHCNPISDNHTGTNMKRLMERSLLLAIHENVSIRQPHCDMFIEPYALKDYHVFDFKKAKKIFQIGYEHTCRLLGEAWLAEKFKSVLS